MTRRSLTLLSATLLAATRPVGAQSTDRSIERWAASIAAAAERIAAQVERRANEVARRVEREFDEKSRRERAARDRWERNDEADGEGQLSRIDTTFAFSATGVVDLSVMSRDVIVTGWDRKEARVRAETERGRFDLDVSASRLTLEQHGGGSNRDHRTITYEVMVPRGARVLVRSSSGDIEVRSAGGEVEASSMSGDVRIDDATARVEVGSISGDVVIRRIKGRVEATTVSGSVEVEDIEGDLKAESTSGDVVVDQARGRDVELSTTSGDVSYAGAIEADGRYEFHSHSGTITLAIPSASSARFAIETFNGEIDSDFPVTLLPGERSLNRRPRRFEFAVGTGGPRIIAETFTGNVEIRKR
ncbi:MAG: DUF4097 family beta strand repeat protein [Gemmatimonadetes bacterium]|nr:DUF4097 family beta strand repeat protein [Gemmatimonadota bacterium]